MFALLQAMWFKGSKGTYANNKKLMCLVVTLVENMDNISINHWPLPPLPF